MRLSKLSSFKILTLQLISTLIYLSFVYCQTQLINGLEDGNIDADVLAATLLFLILFVFFEVFENVCREKAFADCSIRTKEMAANAYMNQSFASHSKTNDEYISFFINEISSALVKTVYVRYYLLKQVVLMVLTFGMLLFLAKVCSIFVFISAVLSGVAVHILSRMLPQKQRHVHDAQADFVQEILDLHRGTEEIHINQMEPLAEDDFKQINLNLENAQYSYQSSLLNIEIVATAQNLLIYILVLIVGGYLASNDIVGVGVFVSAAELSSLILNSWATVTQMYPLMRGSKPTKLAIENFIMQDKVPYRKVMPTTSDILIEAKDLDIRYEPTKPLITDINISLRKGEKYLLIGESGSGKSSFVECLVGNQAAFRGNIHYYTDRIEYVPQEPFIFSGTLRDNLLMGTNQNEQEVTVLLNEVGLELDLDMLLEPQGNNLSGGQKARVALVRALLSTPDLLIVDEITANMDYQLAERINNLLTSANPNMAVLHISHSAHCTTDYNCVFSIKDCKLVEVIS